LFTAGFQNECARSFGIWSDAIKKQYHLSQIEVAGIGTAGNVGAYMAIFAGLFYDSLRGMNRYIQAAHACPIGKCADAQLENIYMSTVT